MDRETILSTRLKELREAMLNMAHAERLKTLTEIIALEEMLLRIK